MRNKIYLSILVAVILVFALCPPEVYAEREIGGEPGSFLTWGQGARALGMGGAFVGMADDASALWWNPAGLTQLNKMELTTLYAPLWEDTHYNFLGYAHPTVNWGTLGLGLMQIESNNFQKRASLSDTPTTFNMVQQAVLLSYGNRFLEQFATGLTFKMVDQKMLSYTDNQYGIDASAFYRSLDKKLALGVNFQNMMAPRLKLKETADRYPLTVKCGGSYTLVSLFPERKDKLSLAIEMDYSTFSKYFLTSLGVEYWMNQSFALRLGKDKNNDLTFGFGGQYAGINLDYALVNHELGVNHRFSLTYRFGYLGEAKYSEEAIKKKINEYYLKGVDYYDGGKYSLALTEWEKALIWNPGDEKIQKMMEEANRQLEAIVNKKLLEEHIDKAYTLYESGNLIESLEQWKEVAKLDPANARAGEYIDKINGLLDKEDKQIYVEREKEKEILTITGYLNKGDEYYNNGRYKEAIGQWQKILAIRPEHLQARKEIAGAENKLKEEINLHFTKGVELYNSNQTAEAIRELNQVLSYDATNKEAQDYLTKAKERAQEITLSKKTDQKKINTLYYQSADLYLKGNYQESIEILNQILGLDPANENALKLLSKVQSVKGVLEKK